MITTDEIDKLISGESVIRIWVDNRPQYYLFNCVFFNPSTNERLLKLSNQETSLFASTDNSDVVAFTKNEWTNREHARKLQEALVQCCIDFFNENPNTNVEEVRFNIDCLQESIKNKKWHPYSDSYISLNGISDNGRVTLAEYM